MSFNATAAEFMESVVHNNHLYRVPGCLRISKTMTISNLGFELINNSFNNVISPWKVGTVHSFLIKPLLGDFPFEFYMISAESLKQIPIKGSINSFLINN